MPYFYISHKKNHSFRLQAILSLNDIVKVSDKIRFNYLPTNDLQALLAIRVFTF